MTAVAVTAPLALLAAAIVVPLVREYLSYRQDWGLGPLGAFLTTLSFAPALALGLTVAALVAAEPVLQWLTTVVVTLVGYSVATAAVRPSVTAAARRSA